jgi:CRISPR-associated exonuclease Cas4
MLGDIVPPGLLAAMSSEAEEDSRQRLRLLHVACTRAMDMLILPELPWIDDGSWARAIDYRLHDIPELNLATYAKQPFARAPESINAQTPELFKDERARIVDSFKPIQWIRPSEGDPDIVEFETNAGIGSDQLIDGTTLILGGSIRGVILHKLMEELLTGELEPSSLLLEERAVVIARQLALGDQLESEIDARELAAAAMRTISLPELSDRSGLVPEVPVYGRVGADDRQLITGRADAVRFRDGRAQIVFDWKSDAAPEQKARASYANQLALYVAALDAERGAIVYMTSGQIQWVNRRRGPDLAAGRP